METIINEYRDNRLYWATFRLHLEIHSFVPSDNCLHWVIIVCTMRFIVCSERFLNVCTKQFIVCSEWFIVCTLRSIVCTERFIACTERFIIFTQQDIYAAQRFIVSAQGIIFAAQRYIASGNNLSFCQHVSSPSFSSPTYEVDSPMSWISSDMQDVSRFAYKLIRLYRSRFTYTIRDPNTLSQ